MCAGAVYVRLGLCCVCAFLCLVVSVLVRCVRVCVCVRSHSSCVSEFELLRVYLKTSLPGAYKPPKIRDGKSI